MSGKDFDLLRNSRPTVPMYADERELLVLRPFSQSVSVPKRVFRHAGGAHLKDAPHCLIVLTSVFCDVREGAAEDAAQIIECAGADVAVFAQAVELTAADAVLLTVGLLTACGGSGLSKQMLVGKWSYIYILQRTQKLSEVKNAPACCGLRDRDGRGASFYTALDSAGFSWYNNTNLL